MSASIDTLVPELQQPARDLLDVGTRAGINPRITSTFRTYTEQAKYYRRYLAGASQYPVAPPGRSAHEFGLAFDLIVFGEQNQLDMGQVWISWGGVWHPSDNIHFEYPGFHPPAAAEEIVASQEPEPGFGKAVDLIVSFTGLGYAIVAAELLKMFPGFTDSDFLALIASPYTLLAHFLQHVRHLFD